MQNFKLLVPEQFVKPLRAAIQNRQSILIVGKTGSGKTLLLNALAEGAAALFPAEQIAVLRDTAERVKTKLANLASRTDLRHMTPELQRSIKGVFVDEFVNELRANEVTGFLKALNTGHFGAVAVYGSTIEQGFHRLQSLLNTRNTPSDSIDLAVLMERTAQGPRVTKIQTKTQASQRA